MMTRFVLGAVACLALVCTGMENKEVDLDGVKCCVNAKADAKAGKSAEYREANVYFCCGNCLKKFNTDNSSFTTAANKQLVETKQYEQSKCPISGKDINPAQKSKVGGIEVAYCCGGCKSKVDKAGDDTAKAELVFADGAFEKGYTKVEAEEK